MSVVIGPQLMSLVPMWCGVMVRVRILVLGFQVGQSHQQSRGSSPQAARDNKQSKGLGQGQAASSLRAQALRQG